MIAAISRQIGRMRPPVRPTRGRRTAADYERHNAFLAFITNAADAPADYEPTFIVVRTRTCDVACHVLVRVCMYTTRTKVKICQSIRCTVYTFIISELFIYYKFSGISRKGTHLSLRVPVRKCIE